MAHFAVTQGTAAWLLSKPGILDALHDILLGEPGALSKLSEAELVEGSFRLSGYQRPGLICGWNVDYTSGLSDDAWGFITLGSARGLARRLDISREVLERCLYVINQRLQGLLIDGAFIHRAYPNGTHTCMAGRGSEARQVSIAYVEREVSDGPTLIRTVLCAGPEYDWHSLSQETAQEAEILPALLPVARRLYAPDRVRSVLDTDAFSRLREALSAYSTATARDSEFSDVNVETDAKSVIETDAYRTAAWTYDQWVSSGAPLSPVQRRLVYSDALEKHPIRIIGPAGSGKTLLMQLLAMSRLSRAEDTQTERRILYLVHNLKMADTVRSRFAILGGERFLAPSSPQSLQVSTLTQYGLEELSLEANQIIDPDAHEAKEFQGEILKECIRRTIRAHPDDVSESQLFGAVQRDEMLLPVLVTLLMGEISTAIKGHGLANDEQRYVQSQRPLSRLHGVLRPEERSLVFEVFRQYHRQMFDGYGVLDSDDVAISLLGRLRTPVWEMRRRVRGFDHVFVDEAQLFNENERRVLPFLTRGTANHVPIVLALDEAQDLQGQVSAGWGTLGLENVSNESLSSVHRSSKPLIRLAFFVIQRSTDLFGPDFPDFTGIVEGMRDDDVLDTRPRVEVIGTEHSSYARSVLKRIRALRKQNLRRIAVICMAESYWKPVLDELRQQKLPLHVLEHRGEKLGQTDPIVVLSRPEHIGGQEFDAVLMLGAEHGLFPPRVVDNAPLASAVEQQALREIYLAITRARHVLVVALSQGASLTPVLEEATAAGLLDAPEAPSD